MIFVGETKDKRLVLFGKDGKEYFYIEFVKDVEKAVIVKYGLKAKILLQYLENNLDRYCQKGLNVVFEKLEESTGDG